jgi:PAS domain S-box-containing protein
MKASDFEEGLMTTQQQGTVLYVDDDESNRRALALVFRDAGFLVKEAGTGGEALRLAAEKPDLVVLDVQLPDVNGFEVCRRIRADPATTAIPVMHLSAVHVSPEDRRHALEEGADVYLTKPVEPGEVVAQARALLRTHRAEEMARASARQWQATFAALNDGVCLLDRNGRVLRCNPALGKVLGRPPETIVGKSCHELTPGSEGAPAFRRMLQTRRREVEEMALGDRWLQAVADPMLEPDGGLSGAVYVLSDVTERKRLEARLRQTQKMEALGQLAGGVAHDFNNLLTAVTGNVSLLLSGKAEQDPDRELLQAVEQAAWRAADLARQLLGFARKSEPRLRPLDLRLCLEEVARLLRRTFDPRIVVEVAAADGLWPAQADPGQINQVLMNLCLNSRDAMPEGGRLELSAENVVLTESQARQSAEARPGEFVRLRVLDSGRGIPPEVMPHLFEPFFTTKGKGEGTGLGLATVYGIVQQHQGWVECESAVGRGACFDVHLPRSAEGGGPAAAPAPPAAPTGTETLLLADDDRVLRTLGSAVLQRHGYKVLVAADGQEAVEIYEKEGPRIDLVILDLSMPRLSGRDAHRRLRQLNPQVRVLLCSGHPAEAAEAAREGALGYVSKPYRGQDLAAAVRKALDEIHPPPAAAEPARPAEEPAGLAWEFSRHDLTKEEAEELLDWLEGNGCVQRDVVCVGDRFVVRWRPPAGGSSGPHAGLWRGLHGILSRVWRRGGSPPGDESKPPTTGG